MGSQAGVHGSVPTVVDGLGVYREPCLKRREPKTLVGGTDVKRPTQATGGLLPSSALPLLSFGSRLQWP